MAGHGAEQRWTAYKCVHFESARYRANPFTFLYSVVLLLWWFKPFLCKRACGCVWWFAVVGFTVVRWLRVTPAEHLGAVLFDKLEELCFNSAGELFTATLIGWHVAVSGQKKNFFFSIQGNFFVPWRVPDICRIWHSDSGCNRDNKERRINTGERMDSVFLLHTALCKQIYPKYVTYYTFLDIIQSFWNAHGFFFFPPSPVHLNISQTTGCTGCGSTWGGLCLDGMWSDKRLFLYS